jgi:PadR family transcriptional regulator, regulatory protein PadR
MTLQVKYVLRSMLSEPSREWYGLELCDLTELPAGTMYPILARLEGYGWLESRWENVAEQAAAGRPPRRYYRFSRDGAETARVALASHRPKARSRAIHEVRAQSSGLALVPHQATFAGSMMRPSRSSYAWLLRQMM